MAARVEDVRHMPVYSTGRIIYSGARYARDLFWYFAVNQKCLAGFANDPTGTGKKPNAKIVMGYDEDRLQCAYLKITCALKPGTMLYCLL
jgi:hypothetical protein